jgi:hypothetical protein
MTSTEPLSGLAVDEATARGKPPGAIRRALRWWLGAGKDRARAEKRPALNEEGRELLSRGRVARELADRIVAGVDLPRDGSGLPVAIDLYRQATYWGLLAEQPRPGRPAFPNLLFASEVILNALGLPADEREAINELFVTDIGFVSYADLPFSEQRRTAELAAAFVERLFERHDAAARRFHLGVFFRVLRIVGLPLLLAGAVWFAVVTLKPKKPNLAAGMPWTTSSSMYPCAPDKGECGGVKTNILFHTQNEKEPWFEIDLGKKTRFSSVEVQNRSDFGQDRAVPLILEASDDKISYKQLARRTKVFSTWEAVFAPTEARYVRLRVERTSMLHLDAVEIHP